MGQVYTDEAWLWLVEPIGGCAGQNWKLVDKIGHGRYAKCGIMVTGVEEHNNIYKGGVR